MTLQDIEFLSSTASLKNFRAESTSMWNLAQTSHDDPENIINARG